MTALPTAVRNLVDSERVTELQLWYTDELGDLEVVTIAGDELESLVARGVARDDPPVGSQPAGGTGDTVAVPDWHTFRLLPPSTHGPSAAAVSCCLQSAALVDLDDLVL